MIQSGHIMVTSSTWSVSGTGSKVQIESGGVLTATSAITVATATTFQIDNGGAYNQNVAASMGSTILAGTEVFGSSSSFTYNTAPTGTSLPSSPGYGNLTINTTANSAAIGWAGTIAQIQGDFNVTATGTGTIRQALTGSPNITVSIGGNFNLSGTNTNFWFSSGAGTCAVTVGGSLNISGSALLDLGNGSGAGTLNLGGNFSQTGGTFTSGNSISAVNFSGGAASATFTQSAGTFTNTNINWSIAAGKTLANNSTTAIVATGKTMTVNGSFQINQGSFSGTTGTWTYGAGAGLLFNNNSGAYGVIDASHVYWPSANGPANVSLISGGGINLGVSRTVTNYTTAAGTTLSSGASLTINGIALMNTGAYFANRPTFGSASTLKYNTGGTYGSANEWITTSGAGYPANVQISNNTTVNLPNGNAGIARQCSGNLTIDLGSALDMNGSTPMTATLTVLGSVNLSGTLSLSTSGGGDIRVGGNWNFIAGGTFNSNSRAVFFIGATQQVVSRSAGGSLNFDYFINQNSGGGIQLAPAPILM